MNPLFFLSIVMYFIAEGEKDLEKEGYVLDLPWWFIPAALFGGMCVGVSLAWGAIKFFTLWG